MRGFFGRVFGSWRERVVREAAGRVGMGRAVFGGGMEELEERRMMYAFTGTQWAQPGGTGTPITLTYSYSNLLDGGLGGGLSASQIRSTIEEALSVWSSVAPINFQEVADSGPAPSDTSYSAAGNPTIRFGYHAIDGAGGTLAHTYSPSNDGLGGDLHFDGAESFSVGPSAGHIDLLYTATHEIGHALGLAHSTVTPSVMAPSYQAVYGGADTAFLYADDVSGIQAIYGAGFGTVINGSGQLVFRGTEGADNIQLGTSGTSFTVTEGGISHTYSGVTSALVRGAAGSDTISASGISLPVTLRGGTGDDILQGGSGSDSINGGAGNDYLSGGFGSNVIEGGGGGDTITYAGLSAGWSVSTGSGTINGMATTR